MLDRWTFFTQFIIIPPSAEWCLVGALAPPLMLLLLVSPWTNGMFAVASLAASDDALTNCLEHTVTSGTFDQYYALADVGNRPSERHLVNVSVTVVVRNRQEELAILLSGEDRSYQHPDYARTYEMRLTNVYTVLYREMLKLRAYHSPLDKLFPADRFLLRFLIGRDGNLTVLVNDEPGRTLLAVIEERPPLDVQYVSFASRMNAYPIQYYLGCGMPQYEATTLAPPTEPPTEEPAADSFPVAAASTSALACPVCEKQRCQVVVKACADNTRDGNGAVSTRNEQEQQKYYFYFNLYLTKNRTKSAARKPANEST